MYIIVNNEQVLNLRFALSLITKTPLFLFFCFFIMIQWFVWFDSICRFVLTCFLRVSYSFVWSRGSLKSTAFICVRLHAFRKSAYTSTLRLTLLISSVNEAQRGSLKRRGNQNPPVSSTCVVNEREQRKTDGLVPSHRKAAVTQLSLSARVSKQKSISERMPNLKADGPQQEGEQEPQATAWSPNSINTPWFSESDRKRGKLRWAERRISLWRCERNRLLAPWCLSGGNWKMGRWEERWRAVYMRETPSHLISLKMPWRAKGTKSFDATACIMDAFSPVRTHDRRASAWESSVGASETLGRFYLTTSL